MQEKMTGQEIEENTLVSRWVNEYMKEKEKREQLEKDYKLLEEKYEQALNDYDELVQSRSDCKVCEDAFTQKLSELNKLQWFYDILNKALDIKEELNKALRDENEELKNKIRVYKMTDKEQIIIDGVDVSGCEYFRPNSTLTCSLGFGGSCDYKYSDKQCRFKQLARYRKALEEIEAATKINCKEICGRKFEDCNDTSCLSAEFLNIINKAKGEGNGLS